MIKGTESVATFESGISGISGVIGDVGAVAGIKIRKPAIFILEISSSIPVVLI